MKIEQIHELFLNSSGVSTDTRKINHNSIFFALKGDNFNGNSFALQALEKGASYAFIDEQPVEQNSRLILVQDVLTALQELSTFHRIYLNTPIISLTGSNGKTTTKELINAVLSKKYKTTATVGNLNNPIGVPLTLLSMTRETEIGIVEMGANHQKEIEFLCGIAQPDYGYITNFGKAHLEGFGSVEGVIKGKSELYDFLKQNNKTVFLNYDDPIQKKQFDYHKTYSFGSSKEADLQIQFPMGSDYASIQYNDLKIESNLIGAYNAKNMAAAFSIGKYFDVPEDQIKAAIKEYTPRNNRSQIIQKGSTKIILDAYNANPTSMVAAIENFENLKGASKIVFLGDMFEMGAQAADEHQQLVNKMEASNIEKVILLGENFHRTTTATEKIQKFKNFEDFKAAFNPKETEGKFLLIKGSRGMALERIVDLL
ncbi:UDP-N-acetylmuramoyl-tripeptide--D-alanyl-D-alanine ligase [Salinimicrobium marinum]|uniref:UDP-N-acetylmuramoyl-tripeptide--D-alanyl-D-alanine ligase n=1 Tax=Salinimicrobium marinum TaxID=680283 RepID=A0A918SGE6_9FLAO|nr:UDP-N-acetylmuramoyl-tripeptide--D-alanyl-D-alanine ligase [Salinimicrobium marinum]GHA40628.1 UDP-N-acetylmuramoyl-tripeptide--D-alanyl-D-alanine ligase [Salinimicrobium marinum]